MTTAQPLAGSRDLPVIDLARHLRLPSLKSRLSRLSRWGLEAAQVGPSTRALDIGCGDGAAARHLLSLTQGRVAAVDRSGKAVETTRASCRAAVNQGRLKVAQGTETLLPFSSASFDLVTVLGCLHTWRNLATGLRETRRVLAPGGSLVIALDLATAHRQGAVEKPLPAYQDAEQLIMACQRVGFRRVVTESHPSRSWLRVVAQG